MAQLNFTTRVLGLKAAGRLRRKEVTQTLRSGTCDIVVAYLHSRENLIGRMLVALDGELVGQATPLRVDTVDLDHLTIYDARWGGFDSISELVLALKRAGYRFQPIENYTFHRILFSWKQ